MASKHGRALNDRQERFVHEYLRDLNATAAYRRAGYKSGGHAAESSAHNLLRTPEVQAAIAEQQQRGLTAADLSVERVLREVARLAFSDVRRAFNENGELKDVRELDDDTAAAVASLETVSALGNLPSEDDGPSAAKVKRIARKLRVWDKTSALSLAMRYHGLLRDNVALTGAVSASVKYTANMPRRGEDDAPLSAGDSGTLSSDDRGSLPATGQ